MTGGPVIGSRLPTTLFTQRSSASCSYENVINIKSKQLANLKRLVIRHLPFFNLKENLAEKFPSHFQTLPSDFRYWEFSTISPNSDGEIRNSDGNFSARGPVRLKKGSRVNTWSSRECCSWYWIHVTQRFSASCSYVNVINMKSKRLTNLQWLTCSLVNLTRKARAQAATR